MNEVQIKFKKVSDDFHDVSLPSYQTSGSAGLDIRATVKEPMKIEKGKIVLVPTNLSVEIPIGFEIQVRPRSGLAIKHGIGLVNSPGTIDSDFRGEIKIILINHGEEDFIVNNGDRIAQLVLSKVYSAIIVVADSLGDTARGTSGFGDSGVK
ncbi:MAG: dUTP diphosphatase [Chlorobiaceae bacterium]|nr:dUTP diphosphatase [Chlorobiaceae bacterium]